MLRPVGNPPNPYHAQLVEYLGEPPPARLQVYEERARSILSENESPDIGFRWSLNPYRGCVHACAYCYARPYHQYLDWGAGTDFERKIVVKVNAPELLQKQFEKKSWRGEPLAFSGVTDCYQHLEANYQVTQRCLEVCLAYRNPLGIITKSPLIRRDTALLAELSKLNLLGGVYFSIPFADPEVARKLEPGVPPPEKRFEAMRALSEAGVRVGISLAPLIPGLSESYIPELLSRARECGARRCFVTLLKLSREVLPVFVERVQEAFPERANKILNGIRAMRDGKLNDSDFYTRQVGQGPRWEAAQRLFEVNVKRFGFNQEEPARTPPPFRRPRAQGDLFL